MCFGKKKKAKKEEAKKLAAQKEAEEAAKKEETKEVKEQPKEEKAEAAEETTEETSKARKALYRVVYDKEDRLWKIKKDGAKRVIDSKKTKEEAIARVQELSQSQDSSFVVHKKDGKFQKKANLNLKSDKGEN